MGYKNIDGFYVDEDSILFFYVRQVYNKKLKRVISDSLRWQLNNKHVSSEGLFIKRNSYF